MRAFAAMLRAEFAIDWHGFHGAAHWARVARNGLILCRAADANPRVVWLFALLHDLRREGEGQDAGHGARSAELVREIADEHLRLNRNELAQLADACAGHSDGGISKNATIAACWDADRLDLGRVDKRVRPEFLSLPAARDPETIARAHRRATAWLTRRHPPHGR